MKKCDYCAKIFDETKQKIRVLTDVKLMQSAVFCEYCKENVPLDVQYKRLKELSLMRG